MEENAEELQVCPSTEMAIAISQKPYVIVPFQWGRYMTSSGYIFYTSPSGRVLLSIEDVISYLEEVDSCKCFYDSDLNFNEIFSFDTDRCSLLLPPKEENNCHCEQFWSESISKDWNKQLATDLLTGFFKDYISKSEFYDKLNADQADEVLIYLLNSSEENNLCFSTNFLEEETCQLLSVLSSKHFIVSKSGHVFPRSMSRSQLKHFTCELVSKTVSALNLPQEYFVVLSGQNKAIEATMPRQETAKSDAKTKKQKPKRVQKKKNLSKEEVEAQIKKIKDYQREYRLKQKLKLAAKKIPQTNRLTRRTSSRIAAKTKESLKEHVTAIESIPKRKVTFKKYDEDSKELGNALKFLLEERPLMELCSANFY